jgi:hypothetical protein
MVLPFGLGRHDDSDARFIHGQILVKFIQTVPDDDDSDGWMTRTPGRASPVMPRAGVSGGDSTAPILVKYWSNTGQINNGGRRGAKARSACAGRRIFESHGRIYRSNTGLLSAEIPRFLGVAHGPNLTPAFIGANSRGVRTRNETSLYQNVLHYIGAPGSRGHKFTGFERNERSCSYYMQSHGLILTHHGR